MVLAAGARAPVPDGCSWCWRRPRNHLCMSLALNNWLDRTADYNVLATREQGYF